MELGGVVPTMPYTNNKEVERWEKDFDSKIPKDDDSLFSANCESDSYDFGYKHMSDDTIHTVTDWGNIKKFLHQELQKARAEERKKVLWNIRAMIEEADFARKVAERTGEALPTLEVQAVIKQVQIMLDRYQSELDQQHDSDCGIKHIPADLASCTCGIVRQENKVFHNGTMVREYRKKPLSELDQPKGFNNKLK